VEIYQSEINKKKVTKLAMPVVFYSQLMAVSYGNSLKEAGLDGHVIQPKKLQQIADQKNNHTVRYSLCSRLRTALVLSLQYARFEPIRF
jgi:hypothetical protein